MKIDPDTYAAMIKFDVEAHDTTKPRAMLTDQGHLGMSSLRCREQARRVLLQIPASDSPPKWAAIVGTAIDAQFETALADAHPDWLFKTTVTAKLPSGFEITGTLDWADPSEPSVTDLKSKAGLALARKHWSTEWAYRAQRHLLYLGMVQEHGWSETGTVRNVVVDRSGKDPYPFVWDEPYDPSVITEIDAWVSDVMYAVKNQETASKDVSGAACTYCPFFTSCRGGDIETGLITTPSLALAVDRYADADEVAKNANALRDELRPLVLGVSGRTQRTILTTTQVASNGSRRINVRKIA